MMANHTSIATLAQRNLREFDKLWKRNAFLDNYKKEEMFMDSLDEFEVSRNVVQELIDEYQASESADYNSWGLQSQ